MIPVSRSLPLRVAGQPGGRDRARRQREELAAQRPAGRDVSRGRPADRRGARRRVRPRRAGGVGAARDVPRQHPVRRDVRRRPLRRRAGRVRPAGRPSGGKWEGRSKFTLIGSVLAFVVRRSKFTFAGFVRGLENLECA